MLSLAQTLFAGCTAAFAASGFAKSELTLVKLSEEAVAFHAGDPALDPRIDLAYFDGEYGLRWNDRPVYTQATGACETQALSPARLKVSYPPRRPRMFNPRVDERYCPGGDARRATEKTLVGIDERGMPSWQRPLIFESGTYQLDLHLIGATPEGLVLSSLEVWSPRTGRTLVTARTRKLDDEAREVPIYEFAYSAIYHPQRNEFYVFGADVTLVRREGGLWRVRPSAGDSELVHPVRTTTVLGSYDRVHRMALTPDGRYLLLAQEEEYRGPATVSFAVLNLDSRKLVFEERFCRRRDAYCRDPQVLVAPNGDIGFAYSNLNLRQHVLIRYRIGP